MCFCDTACIWNEECVFVIHPVVGVKFYIHCSVHHYNCLKNNQHDDIVDYPLFSGVVVIHSLHVSSFR